MYNLVMIIDEVIKKSWDSLTKSEQRVGKLIIKIGIDESIESITKFAKKADVSVSLVIKFCKKIGISGWKELKNLYLNDLSIELNSSERNEDFLNKMIMILNLSISTKQNFKNKIKKIADRIMNKSRTIVFSNEYTTLVIQPFLYKLRKLGIDIVNHSFEMGDYLTKDNDHILFISISGIQPKIEDKIEKIPISNKVSLITFGQYKNDRISKKIQIKGFHLMPKHEKSYPIYSDISLQVILNRIFKIIFDSLNKSK